MVYWAVPPSGPEADKDHGLINSAWKLDSRTSTRVPFGRGMWSLDNQSNTQGRLCSIQVRLDDGETHRWELAWFYSESGSI